MKAIDEFGALLHSYWQPGKDEETITGAWAEDGSTFEITAPHQLRDLLIALQRRLSQHYQDTMNKRRELVELEAAAERMIGK